MFLPRLITGHSRSHINIHHAHTDSCSTSVERVGAYGSEYYCIRSTFNKSELKSATVLLIVIRKNICNFSDGYISIVVDLVDNIFHPDNLITVNNKIYHGFFFV